MAQGVIKEVYTQSVGFAPILRRFFNRCGIAEIIDQNVHLDPRRKVLTHGQASIASITGILFQAMRLYRFCQFADQTSIPDVILPGIDPKDYFDDRLADTLDALCKHGIGDMELLITQKMISEFEIDNSICHNDTTSISVFGDCNSRKTVESINITFGHSKKHRKDLKQFVWSLSVSSDSGFPLFEKAYSGDTADVTTYVEQRCNLIDLSGFKDFLYVADSKFVTHENMAQINDNDGFFIAPAPMCESYKTVFYQAVGQHDHEVLLPYKKQINRGFEVPLTISHEERDYEFRMIILFDHGLFARKRRTLENRVKKTEKAFDELNNRLNVYRLKTEESIDKACHAILKKYKTADFFDFTIQNDPITTYKNKKRGRPGKNAQKVAVITDHFSVRFTFNKNTFEEELWRADITP